jgi:putative heme-binding domain-containing protein
MQITATMLLPCFLALLLAPSRASFPEQEPPVNIDLVEGKQLFEDHCSVCHGLTGAGGRGPNLHTPKLKHAADEKGIRSIIANGLPGMPDAWYLSDEEVANVAAYVKGLGTIPPEKVPGDPAAGSLVYQRGGCSACHILAGKGNGFGPDLNEVGARRGAAQLASTLRNPEKNIPAEFLLIEVTPASGASIQGVRLNEDSFSIQLRDSAGRIYSFRKSDLLDLKKLRGQTPMPSYAGMPDRDLQNLVAFLAAQRGAE